LHKEIPRTTIKSISLSVNKKPEKYDYEPEKYDYEPEKYDYEPEKYDYTVLLCLKSDS
jgi:hypothetical protein